MTIDEAYTLLGRAVRCVWTDSDVDDPRVGAHINGALELFDLLDRNGAFEANPPEDAVVDV